MAYEDKTFSHPCDILTKANRCSMDEDNLNIQIRKFLKQVGIKSQREIEDGIRQGFIAGTINENTPIQARMTLEIEPLKISTVIEGKIN